MVSLRLRELRDSLGYSQKKMGDLLNIAQTTYANYESGKANIPDELKIKLLNKLKLNINWLLSGYGNMFINEDYPESNPIFKTPSGKSYPITTDSAIYSVPILASKVSAGNGQEWLPSDYSGETLPTLEKFFLGYPKDDIFAAKVVGDSMIGIDLLPGDYVYACHGRIEGNGLYVLTLDNETYVKRLEIDKIDRKIRIISENDHYPDKVVDPERVIILGKVIGWLHRTPY